MNIYNQSEVETDEVAESPAQTLLATLALIGCLAVLVLALVVFS